MFKGSGEATWPTGGGAEGWPGAVQRPMHLGMADTDVADVAGELRLIRRAAAFAGRLSQRGVD